MKNLIRFILLGFIIVITNTSCEKEEMEPKVDENGLTKEITDLVPQYILDEMIALGMPINGGANPPDIEGTYFGSPFRLVSSNRPGDVVGSTFADYTVTFSGQDNEDLSIKVDYVNGPESGIGLGSFIVGDGCSFSVFVEIDATHSGGTNAKFTHVLSGNFINGGIANLHCANFMLDNYGNPQGVFIENGEGRVVRDADGFSEKTGATTSWYDRLPDCPCTYEEAKSLGETDCHDGYWDDCNSSSESFHYGATYEVRWVPNNSGQPGQQCTYDSSKKLITGGIAAGSPDKVSPEGCGYGDFINAVGIFVGCSFDQHCINDVQPWVSGSFYSVPCWQYLRDWPANKVCSGGTENIINGIDHMKKMVESMTCEDVTFIIKTANESPNILIDADLRRFIIGENISLSDAQLISKLENWKALKSCNLFPTDRICVLIDTAISNLQ